MWSCPERAGYDLNRFDAVFLRNAFLGIAYVVVGAACLIFAPANPACPFFRNDAIAESSLQNLCCTWKPWDGIIFSLHGRYFSSIASTAATRAGGTAVVHSVVNPNLEFRTDGTLIPKYRESRGIGYPKRVFKESSPESKIWRCPLRLYDSMYCLGMTLDANFLIGGSKFNEALFDAPRIRSARVSGNTRRGWLWETSRVFPNFFNCKVVKNWSWDSTHNTRTQQGIVSRRWKSSASARFSPLASFVHRYGCCPFHDSVGVVVADKSRWFQWCVSRDAPITVAWQTTQTTVNRRCQGVSKAWSISNVKTVKDSEIQSFWLDPGPSKQISDVWRARSKRAVPLEAVSQSNKKVRKHILIFYFDIAYQAGSAGKTSLQVSDGPMVYCRLSNKWCRTTSSFAADSVLMSKAFLTTKHGKASWENSLQRVFRWKSKTTTRSTRLKRLRPFEWQRWAKIGLKARRWSLVPANSEIQLWSCWSTIDGGDCILMQWPQ